MPRPSPRLLLALPLFALLALSARAATPLGAAAKLREFLDGIPQLGPGYAVVVVDRERRLLDYVRGQRDALSGTPLTLDTPIYIASQTKAYMGLLAHRLDQRGVLRLDARLTDYWPELAFPAGVDASAWTLADLLNHRVPIRADAITGLEAYIASPDPALYPRLLAAFAQPRAPGFDYDNLGYNIYAAILHQRTGKSWQDWLQQEIFTPLRLQHTSARTSTFAADALAAGHTWLGEDDGWERVTPKSDGIMHSAGGMVTSPNDMARWLQLHLRASGPRGFGPELFAAAHRRGASVDPGARNAYELPCSGYAFGWNLCDFEGHRLYIHGGGYTGARSMMAFAPDLGVGIAVFSNSDNMTGWLTSRTVVQFLQFLVDHPEADAWAVRRQGLYPQRVAEHLADRRGQRATARAEARWEDWRWSPDSKELAPYVGTYRHEALPVTATLSASPEGLMLSAGALRRRLAPAKRDLFGATWLRLDPPEPLRFLRDADGTISGFDFDGGRYRRTGEGS